MKITFIPDLESQTPKKFPYVARYGSEGKIFVLVESEQGETSSGRMMNSNATYSPFEHYSVLWKTDLLKPFKGKITIKCP